MDITDVRYDSVEAFIPDAIRPVACQRNAEFVAHKDDGAAHASWSGATSTLQAVTIIRTGWPEGRQRVAELQAAVGDIAVPEGFSRRRKRTRGPVGDHWDMQTALRGRHDIAWISTVRKRVAAPVFVDIVINVATPSGDAKEVSMWRGAVAVALSDILEARGFRVRIVVGWAVKGIDFYRTENTKSSTRIIAKAHGQPLDEATIAAVMHPCMPRMLGIRWMWANYEKASNLGAGKPSEVPHTAGEIYISHEVECLRTAKKKLAEILESFTQQTAAA